jgi:type I restriction enzyme R subunit
MTDEAHRSQYDTLALNMRNALPKAAFIGFTGTPLMAREEKTKEVFGDYVSIYNFRQSIEDGATVPLFYENRIPELELANENFKEDLDALIEAAESAVWPSRSATRCRVEQRRVAERLETPRHQRLLAKFRAK